MVDKGIISGYPDGLFRPDNQVQRAESAALLWRANQYGNDNNFYYVKDNAIYMVDMNGKSEAYASFDDFDVIDLLPIQSMNLLTISQDDILFYDSNEKAIRRIMKSDNIKG